MWKGCPSDYLAPVDTVAEESKKVDDDMKSPSESSYTPLDPPYVPDESFSPPTRRASTRSRKGTHTPPRHVSEEASPTPKNGSPAPPGGGGVKAKEDLLLEAELAELALAEERLDKLRTARDRRQKAEEDFERLSRQYLGEGARKKTVMIDTVNSMRAANNQPKISRKETTSYSGPTIDIMRSDPRTKMTVDRMLADDVHTISALSNSTSRPQRGKPRLKTPALPPSPQRDGHSRVSRQSQALGSPVTTAPRETHYRWETGVDRYGVEYRSLVEVTPVKSLASKKARTLIPLEDGWVYDEEMGRAYHANHVSPNVSQSRRGVHSRSALHPDRYRTHSTPPRHGRPVLRSPHMERRNQSDADRYSSRVHLDFNPPNEREGKAISIADHARELPLECAKSVTGRNINFAMFMYGAVKELHSSRIGATQPMEPGVLEAKLQHLLNVIHVTCLNSTSSDFKPTAWMVGRTYNNLVQAKVDSGRETWLDFDQLHRGSPHASEMIAAEREHRSALADQLKTGKEAKKVETGGKERKPLCTSWNNSSVEGKCKWEIEHPDTKCNRAHYCSYCEKKTGNSRTNHQEKFCKRKQDEDK